MEAKKSRKKKKQCGLISSAFFWLKGKIKSLSISKVLFDGVLVAVFLGALNFAVMRHNPGDYSGQKLQDYFVSEVNAYISDTKKGIRKLNYCIAANDAEQLNEDIYVVSGYIDEKKEGFVIAIFERKAPNIINAFFHTAPAYQIAFLRMAKAISNEYSIDQPEYYDIDADGRKDIEIQLRANYGDRVTYFNCFILNKPDAYKVMALDIAGFREKTYSVSERSSDFFDLITLNDPKSKSEDIVLGNNGYIAIWKNPFFEGNDILCCIDFAGTNKTIVYMCRIVDDICVLDQNWNNGLPFPVVDVNDIEKIVDEKWGYQDGEKVFYQADVTKEDETLTRERIALKKLHIGVNESYVDSILGIPCVKATVDVNHKYSFYRLNNAHVWCQHVDGEVAAFGIIVDNDSSIYELSPIEETESEEKQLFLSKASYYDCSPKVGRTYIINPASGIVRYYSEIFPNVLSVNHGTVVYGNFFDLPDDAIELMFCDNQDKRSELRKCVSPNAYAVYGIGYEGCCELVPILDGIRDYVDSWYS